MDRVVGIMKMSLKLGMEVLSKITIRTSFHCPTGLQFRWNSWTNFHKNKQHMITWNRVKKTKATLHLQNFSRIIKVRDTSRDHTFCCLTKTPKKKIRPKGLTVEQIGLWAILRTRLRVMKISAFKIREIRCCMFSRMITLKYIVMTTHAKAVLWLIKQGGFQSRILKLKKILAILILKAMFSMRTKVMMTVLCPRVRLLQDENYPRLEFKWKKWWIRTLCLTNWAINQVK